MQITNLLVFQFVTLIACLGIECDQLAIRIDKVLMLNISGFTVDDPFIGFTKVKGSDAVTGFF